MLSCGASRMHNKVRSLGVWGIFQVSRYMWFLDWKASVVAPWLDHSFRV